MAENNPSFACAVINHDIVNDGGVDDNWCPLFPSLHAQTPLSALQASLSFTRAAVEDNPPATLLPLLATARARLTRCPKHRFSTTQCMLNHGCARAPICTGTLSSTEKRMKTRAVLG